MDLDKDIQASKFYSLKTDPVALLELVDKFIEIYLIKDCSFIGFVHSIDPVTHSIILSIPKEDSFIPILIPGHAILDAKELALPTNVTPPVRKAIEIETDMTVAERKNKLIAWFKSNFLPVAESSDSKIKVGNVCVLPPYTPSDICTDNPIIALQIKKFIENMPDGFEPSSSESR